MNLQECSDEVDDDNDDDNHDGATSQKRLAFCRAKGWGAVAQGLRQ